MSNKGRERRTWSDHPFLAAAAFLLGFVLVLRDPIPQLFTLQQLLMITAAMVLAAVAYLDRGNFRAGPWSRAYWFVVLACIFVFSLATALGLLTDREIDIQQGYRDLRDFVVFGVVSFLMVTVDRDRWRALLPAGALGVLFAVGLENLMRGTAVYGLLFDPPTFGSRYVAGFMGPNEYGLLAGSLAVATFVVFRTSGSRAVRILALTAAVLGVATLVSTGSRGGVLGFVLTLVIVVGIDLADRFRRSRTEGLLATLRVGLVGLLFLVAGWWSLIQMTELGELQEGPLVRRLAGEVLEEGAETRFEHLRAAARIGVRFPVLGSGFGGYMRQGSKFGGPDSSSPHNELAKAFAESGAVGLMAISALFVLVLVAAVRQRHQRWGGAVLAAVISILVGEMFFNYLVRPRLSIMIAVVFAAVVVRADALSSQRICQN